MAVQLRQHRSTQKIYATLQAQFGYDTIRGDASTSWFRLAALVLAIASLAALLINRRIPT